MKWYAYPLLLLIVFPLSAEIVPRVVVALYDSVTDPDISSTQTHQMAEMSLNHLGLVLEYHDIRSSLPDLTSRGDVLGVMSWFREEMLLNQKEVEHYLGWAVASVKAGKKFVIFGNPGFQAGEWDIPPEETNRFWKEIGMHDTGDWIENTQPIKLSRYYPQMTQFERTYSPPYPAFRRLVKQSPQATCYLAAKEIGDFSSDACLVTISAKGAYVAGGYESFYLYELGRTSRNWYINPFLFFREAFQTDNIPKPDTTTLAGRRLFYSQVDGDGWNNNTEVWGYGWNTIAAEVLYDRVLSAYSDLPVTVAPIGADIDKAWVGTDRSIETAKKIFLLPTVEVGCHTFTHPFDWAFSEDYRPNDELSYLSLYPSGSWLGRGIFAKIRSYFRYDTLSEERALPHAHVKTFGLGYVVPRAFALQPFSLPLEVQGAMDQVNLCLPQGKEIKLYQWSGDCHPFYRALFAVGEAGVADINGGDTRFDTLYNSYGWVAPLGRQVKDIRQIYASNANENIYTNLWSSDYFGFYLLLETFKNTESPIRVKPMNLYYHVFSAQKAAALNALLNNIEYIRTQEICPVHSSQFSKMVRGFYAALFEKVAPTTWKIKNRGALQTVRFDYASTLRLDFQNSVGVVGERYLQGSLYIYLDREVADCQIALTSFKESFIPPKENRYYLISSRYQVYQVKSEGEELHFIAEGFGPLEMLWNVPTEGKYEITVEDNEQERLLVSTVDQQLTFSLSPSIEPVKIRIKKL